MEKLKKSKNKTMTEQVYEILEDLIVFCKIEPGTILSEVEIAQMIGAGRTPVREALILLSKAYLVDISRSGILIPHMNVSIQLQMLEVRHSILSLCVKCAIDRLNDIDKKNIQELLDEVNSQDDVEFLLWLKRRHEVLAKASKNKFILEELKNVQGLSHRFWYFHAKQEDHEEGKRLHIEILEAVLEQNKEKAIQAVDNLISYLEIFTRKYSI
ncbi:MAG: GntR family transcriptional regulator [Campylobacteraceae bacterium]|nr:GntR family transcriptional regulator [Campylobacteraceae bacterium]